ncbi:MAG TPA: PAS domain-containing protein [Ilumatobacteraceae bacterium]|nr:PAS domain-containing protein [Ilumatobacteraceae bacterium]
MLLDLLPVGVAVIDAYGTIRFANARMLAMIGFSRDDVVGRSVLDFVVSEEFSSATDILTAGRGFIGRTMGPTRLRYRGADGQLRATEMWTQNCLDVAGIDGYVATFAEESVNDHMSRAFASIASGAPLEETLQVVIDSMAVHPMGATAVVALQGPDGLSLVGEWPLAGYDFTIDDPLAPWTFTLRRGQPHDFPDLFGLPAELRNAATQAGFRSVWVRPIVSRRGLRGALIAWRSLAGLTSPNQEQRMADAVALSAVAFDNAELRFDDPAEPGRVIERRDRSDTAAASSATLEEHGAVLTVDVEGIDRVITECGRGAAEAVLALVASRLAATVRAVDEVLDRGPNSFAAVCRPPIDRVAVISIANRIVRVLSGPYFVDGPDSEQLARRIDHLSVNVGIAFQTESSELDGAIERAEDAMRIAASEGTNEWRIADGGRRQRVPL